MTKDEDTPIISASNSHEDVELARQVDEAENGRNTPALDQHEIDAEQSTIREITSEEANEMMQKPVQYSNDYVAPSKDHSYNPGSYSVLGDDYYTNEKHREDVREQAAGFQQTPVFQSLEATSGYKLQLQSQAWDNAPKDNRGLISGDFPLWDTNNFFGNMEKHAPKKKDSMLYGMSSGIRYAIPGAKGKKTSKEDHPFAINLLGGFGTYESGSKGGVKSRASGVGFPTGFINPFTTSMPGGATFKKGDRKINWVKQPNGIFEPDAGSIFTLSPDPDKAKKQTKALKNMRGMYRHSSDEPREYNPGNYSILGANYATSKARRKEVQKDATDFTHTIAFKDLSTQHTDRLETQSHAFILGNSKVVDVDSMNAVYARESQAGRITVDGIDRLGTRISGNKVNKKEELHYTPLGANYFTSEVAAGKVRAKAKRFQKTEEFSKALYRNDRNLLDQSKKWSLVPKQNRQQIDPSVEGYALSGDDKGKVRKEDEGYGGIPYIIPAALFAKNNNKPLSTPKDDGSGVTAKKDPQNVGTVIKATKKQKYVDATPHTIRFKDVLPTLNEGEKIRYGLTGRTDPLSKNEFTKIRRPIDARYREEGKERKEQLLTFTKARAAKTKILEDQDKKYLSDWRADVKEQQRWKDLDADVIKKQNRSISDDITKRASKAAVKQAKLQKERDDKVFGGMASYATKKDQVAYGIRNFDREHARDVDTTEKTINLNRKLGMAFSQSDTNKKDETHKKNVSEYKTTLSHNLYALKEANKQQKEFYKNASPFELWHSGDKADAKRKLAENAKRNISKPFTDLHQGQKDRAASYEGARGWLYGAGRQPNKDGYPTRNAFRYGTTRSPYAGSQVASFFGSMPFGMPKPTSVKMTRRTKSTGKLVLTAAGRKAQSAAKRRAKKGGKGGGFLGSLFGSGGWL